MILCCLFRDFIKKKSKTKTGGKKIFRFKHQLQKRGGRDYKEKKMFKMTR